MNKNIFSEIMTQYPSKSETSNLEQLIKLVSINEKSSGLSSVQADKRQQLIKALANHIEINMTLQYACTYDAFFGGNPKCVDPQHSTVSTHQFDPKETSHFGLKPDNHGIALINHLISKLPHKAAELETLKKVGFLEHMRNIWSTEATPAQQSRQNILKPIIQQYVNGDLTSLLQKEVLHFAKNNGITLENTEKPTCTQSWKSEHELRVHAENQVKPLVKEADRYGAYNHQLIELAKTEANEMRLISAVPDIALNNKTVKEVSNSSSVLEI